MTLQNLIDLITSPGGLILLAMTVIQFTPIKVNPWSTVARAVGKAINGGDVMALLKSHIELDNKRYTDTHRYRILRFNGEILNEQGHSKEEFDEILYTIKEYEHFCRTHPDYENNRCVLAIENIERVYKENMTKKGGFL